MKMIVARMGLVLVCLVSVHILAAQTSRILPKAATDSLFSEQRKKELDIKYPIVRAYQYSDKSGRYYLALTERSLPLLNGKDTLVTHIEAFCLQDDNGRLVQKWKMKDAMDTTEYKIWFWTRFMEVKDLDKDGYIEPLLVYGSTNIAEEGQGRRVKILLYYKGNKIAVRAVPGATDDDPRTLQIDKEFSTLPPPIQSYLHTLMRHMNREYEQYLFPNH
ncbi:MAG TPA: hypothetical protein VLD19_19275 [Chitinophagaceae bacterium]|nr:hypothetical protein [Chitinophagaceae bacterium]